MWFCHRSLNFEQYYFLCDVSLLFLIWKKKQKFYHEDSRYLANQVVLFLCLQITNMIPATEKLLHYI